MCEYTAKGTVVAVTYRVCAYVNTGDTGLERDVCTQHKWKTFEEAHDLIVVPFRMLVAYSEAWRWSCSLLVMLFGAGSHLDGVLL